MKRFTMKTLNNKKERQMSYSLISVLTSLLLIFSHYGAISQSSDPTYSEIEKTQDEIESLYVEIYDIMNEYPEATYKYVYDDGEVTEVLISGIPVNRDQKQLEVNLIDLEDLKAEIYNLSNRVGVYYVTETEPKPTMGYDEFYDQLNDNLTYPDKAEDLGIEGTIYAKFVVDSDGEINKVITTEDLETSANWVVDSLKEEAKEAVLATSGDWIPAKVGGIPVAQWVVIPVQFKIESPYFTPLY